jgi:hypothetical protein
MASPFKMQPKSPMMKALVGKQHRLPDHLKKAIEAAPESPAKSYGSKKDSPMKSYGSKKKSPVMKDPELDEFGNPIPKGFKSDIKGETGGAARSKQSLEKEYKVARSKRARTPSRGKDRKTQFAAAGGDAASLARLKKTDKAEYDRLKSRTQMQDADFKKLTRLKELEAERLKGKKAKSPVKKTTKPMTAAEIKKNKETLDYRRGKGRIKESGGAIGARGVNKGKGLKGEAKVAGSAGTRGVKKDYTASGRSMGTSGRVVKEKTASQIKARGIDLKTKKAKGKSPAMMKGVKGLKKQRGKK